MNHWGPEALLKIRVKLALQRILVKEGKSIALNSKWGWGKGTWDEGTGNCHSSMSFCRAVWGCLCVWSRFCHTPVSCSSLAWQTTLTRSSRISILAREHFSWLLVCVLWMGRRCGSALQLVNVTSPCYVLSPVSSIRHLLSYFTLTSTPWSKYDYYPYSTKVGTEAERDLVTCSTSHSW